MLKMTFFCRMIWCWHLLLLLCLKITSQIIPHSIVFFDAYKNNGASTEEKIQITCLLRGETERMVSPSSVSDVMLISRLLQSSANVGIYLLIVDPPLSVWGRVNILNTIVFPSPPSLLCQWDRGAVTTGTVTHTSHLQSTREGGESRRSPGQAVLLPPRLKSLSNLGKSP